MVRNEKFSKFSFELLFILELTDGRLVCKKEQHDETTDSIVFTASEIF